MNALLEKSQERKFLCISLYFEILQFLLYLINNTLARQKRSLPLINKKKDLCKAWRDL